MRASSSLAEPFVKMPAADGCPGGSRQREPLRALRGKGFRYPGAHRAEGGLQRPRSCGRVQRVSAGDPQVPASQDGRGPARRRAHAGRVPGGARRPAQPVDGENAAASMAVRRCAETSDRRRSQRASDAAGGASRARRCFCRLGGRRRPGERAGDYGRDQRASGGGAACRSAAAVERLLRRRDRILSRCGCGCLSGALPAGRYVRCASPWVKRLSRR
jgi:hypothetical protein